MEKLKNYLEDKAGKYCTLSSELVKVDTGGNTLRFFLVITRKIKSYDSHVDPYDSLKVIVSEDGTYKFVVHGKTIQANVATPPPCSSGPIEDTLDKLLDELWIACPGIDGYSVFRDSIGFDLKRVKTDSCPPDSARSDECPVLFNRQTKSKSLSCDKCLSLKWLLTRRKKEHDAMSAGRRTQRQSTSSCLPFCFESIQPAKENREHVEEHQKSANES